MKTIQLYGSVWSLWEEAKVILHDIFHKDNGLTELLYTEQNT